MVQTRGQEKYNRLLKAADNLFLNHGIDSTSLAMVASESGVPLGNVYYYFKSKRELAEAVIEYRRSNALALLESTDKLKPAQRLQRFIKSFEDTHEYRAAAGCPIGSLCHEAGKFDTAVANTATESLRVILRWLERQFIEFGFDKKNSRSNALHMLNVVQGASLVAQTFSDSGVVKTAAAQLRAWLQTQLSTECKSDLIRNP